MFRRTAVCTKSRQLGIAFARQGFTYERFATGVRATVVFGGSGRFVRVVRTCSRGSDSYGNASNVNAA